MTFQSLPPFPALPRFCAPATEVPPDFRNAPGTVLINLAILAAILALLAWLRNLV